MRVELSRDYRFEAAHRLPMVPPDHKCARMHGHSFLVSVTVAGEVDARMGWLVDFADITAVVESPEVTEQIKKLGCDPLTGSVRDFEDMVAKELRENGELIKKANIKPN